MVLFKSFRYKLLTVVGGVLFLMSLSALLLADHYFHNILDQSQNAVYQEKFDTILSVLHQKHELLLKTGLVIAYQEDFQKSAVETLRKTYYAPSDPSAYPSIIDSSGRVIMHPQYSDGDVPLQRRDTLKKIALQKKGEFLYADVTGEKIWCRINYFEAWDWVVLYSVPLSVKYADVARFRNILILVNGGIGLIALVLLFIAISKTTAPIIRLTKASKLMAFGDLDHPVDVRNQDEIGVLARSFVAMRNSIREKIDALDKKNRDLLFEIDERLRVEQALRESEGNLAITLNSIGDAVVVTDPNGLIIRMNPVAEKLSAMPDIAAKGKPLTEVFRLTLDEGGQAGFNPAESVVQSNHPQDISVDTTLQSTNGEVFKIATTGAPIKNSRNEIVGVVLVFRDVTEKRKLEAQLRQIQKMESIGNLAGGIAHDFNNILAPIVGMAELLLQDLPKGGPEHDNAHEILKAGKRGSELVKQILAFSRRSEQKKIPVRVQQVLAEVLRLTRSTIPADVEIARDIQTDCGPVMADPTQMHQIVMNLITNAYHALGASAGQIEIRLGETVLEAGDLPDSALQSGQYAVLTVSDTGCGIDPKILDKIFDPYFTTKERDKGSGLGLAVVYGIIRELGGNVYVESELRKGTTFTVYFPITESFATPETDVGRKPTPPEGGNERILLVDDEDPIVEVEKQMLERLGYKVTAYTSSQDALKRFRSDPDAFDIVITDMTMPNMTGDQFANALISIKPDLPVIICTGFSERISEDKASDIGVKGFLMKPVLMAELAETVRKLLDEIHRSPK